MVDITDPTLSFASPKGGMGSWSSATASGATTKASTALAIPKQRLAAPGVLKATACGLPGCFLLAWHSGLCTTEFSGGGECVC
eukprot:SAG22_NODE_14744_length_366_cov_0.906367_1_plen_82_part_10